MNKSLPQLLNFSTKFWRKTPQFKQKLLLIFTSLTVCIFSVIGGERLAQAKFTLAQNNYTSIEQEIYLKNCASCHTPIPAEVLPTETWKKILEQTQQHYGQSLPPLDRISLRLIWNYLKRSSRPLLPGEPQPGYITNSRYFKALHPLVELPQPVTHKSCLICHPGAKQLDYRSLNQQWQ